VRDVAVRPGGIALGQLLKFAGLADTGGDAKALLAAGAVAVNGAVEERRGRALAEGDVVEVDGQEPVRVVGA
jgi:ribosome-associated protein